MELLFGIWSLFAASSFLALVMAGRYPRLKLPTAGVCLTAAPILLLPFLAFLFPAICVEVDDWTLVCRFMTLLMLFAPIHLCFFVPIVAALFNPKWAEKGSRHVCEK
jgi:hypothetical protein